ASDPAGRTALAGAIVTITAAPQHGQVVVNPTTHQITYIANPGFVGWDSFSYTITDSLGATSRAATLAVDLLPALPPLSLFALELSLSQQYHFATQGVLGRSA